MPTSGMKDTAKILSTLLVSLTSVVMGLSSASAAENLRGTVSLDGSSTVFLISEVIAEEFNAVRPNIHLNVTLSHRSVIFLQQSANGTM